MRSPAFLLAVVAVSLALMLTRPRRIAEAWWISGGALLLLLTGAIAPAAAVHAVGKGTDVYAFLIGMMLLSALARDNGVFDWLSAAALRRAGGSTSRLFALVYVVGVVVTTMMSNDATAVVLTPAILATTRRAKVNPLPHLYACAFVANAASFVLPISNPANLVVFRGAVPSLGRWLAAFALPSALSIVTTYLVLRAFFRADFAKIIEVEPEASPLSSRGRLVVLGLVVVSAALLVASAIGVELGLPTLVCALVVTAFVCVVGRTSPLPLVREVSWSTLMLVAGLFVLVEAVEGVGALTLTRHWLAGLAAMTPAVGTFVAGFTVGVANNVVNNLPLGLLAGGAMHSAPVDRLLRSAILIGVDLGPNLAVTGSLATILWLLALRASRVHVGFLDFFRIGVVVMPTALASALLGALVVHALGG
ncbi:MAG: SLC13 family permease [Polyangiaceae bacterium]